MTEDKETRIEWRQEGGGGYTHGYINGVHCCYFVKSGHGKEEFTYGMCNGFRISGPTFPDCDTKEEAKDKAEKDLAKWLNSIPGVTVKC